MREEIHRNSPTTSEVKREAAQLGMEGKVAEFINLYEKHRFGGKDMKVEARARYHRLISEIIRQLKS
jgi:hypothetical protein